MLGLGSVKGVMDQMDNKRVCDTIGGAIVGNIHFYCPRDCKSDTRSAHPRNGLFQLSVLLPLCAGIETNLGLAPSN